jgi:hypothetical protein
MILAAPPMRPSPARVRLLAALMGIALSGALPFLSYFFRGFTWMLWGVALVLVILSARELPPRRLLAPMGPYLVWLCCYLGWGLIVTENLPLEAVYAAKVLTTTLLIGACIAQLTARPEHLRSLANAAQYAVAVNLLLVFVLPHSAFLERIVLTVTMRTGLYTPGVGRYGGLWGNPNLGAFVCLIAFALSVFADRWPGWLGRLSCAPLLYLAASRRGLVFFVAMAILYALLVRRNSGRFWFAGLVLASSAAIALSLNLGLRQEVRTASKDAALVRLLDLEERDTMARGGTTRSELLEDYLTVLAGAPWYGYGLQTMAGTQYDENDPNKVVRKGIMRLGTHNTYLGVWLDIGPAGCLAFLLVIGHYLRKCLRYRGTALSRWSVLSLALVMASYLMFSHDLLFVFAGQVAYALFFLLSSRGQLVSQATGWRPDYSVAPG